MKRRDFLSAGVAGATLMGCGGAGVPASQTPSTGRDMKGFLATLDGGLRAIDNGNPFGHVLEEAGLNVPRNQTALAEDLYRKNLRSMLLVGSFGDLTEPDRAHPEMQARMRAGLAQMDDAVLGTAKYFESLSVEDRAAQKRLLAARPGLPMLMAGRLDLEAAKLDISSERRLHLRSLAAHVGWRLQAQQATVIDDFTEKVRAVATKQNAAYLATLQSSSVGYSEAEDPSRAPGRTRGSTMISAPGASSHRRRGATAVTVGALMLGVSAGVVLAGSVMTVAGGGIFGTAVGAAGVFVITAGSVGVVAGLVTLIVGAALNASGP